MKIRCGKKSLEKDRAQEKSVNGSSRSRSETDDITGIVQQERVVRCSKEVRVAKNREAGSKNSKEPGRA